MQRFTIHTLIDITETRQFKHLPGAEIQYEGGTIVGVSGTGNGAYVLVQGGATPSVSGVTVVATIAP